MTLLHVAVCFPDFVLIARSRDTIVTADAIDLKQRR
jgi:hypothetical protein